MAQTGFTPIQLYRTATASAVPLAGNLSDGELALNTNDGRLYYKDSGGTVQVIAYKNVPLSTVTGTLAVANGGTGQTTLQAAINSLAGAVTSGSYLRGNGTNVVMSAIQAGDVPTLNQNTTGTASNVTGTVAVANGGTGATTAPNARTNLGATTVGSNFFTLTDPSAVTFIRVNADNTVSTLDAATFRTAIGAGTGGGSVSSVSGTGTVNGLTLSGTVTTTGSLTLSGAISGVPNSATTATSANTASAIVARDASGNFSAGTITATLSGSATQVSNNLTLATSGTGLSGSATFNGSSAQTFTVTSNATSANTASTIVARDASGNFSAGTITASLSGTATTATNWGSYGAVPAAGTSFGTANTIGRSDANGYTYFGYINSSTSNSENPSVSQVIVTNGGDNFYRKASVAHLTSSLSGTAPISISGNAANVTGTVAVANGGTGATSLTANNVLLGNGTSAVQVVAPGSSGNVLTSNGTTWQSSALPSSTAKTWTAFTSSGTYTVPSGVTSIRAYAFGKGGNGGGFYGGGGGGCAYGDIAVTSGQVVTITISGGVAEVRTSSNLRLQANPGEDGNITPGSAAGGTASFFAGVSPGFARTGGTAVNQGGASSGSPIGNGFTGYGGGAGWGGQGGFNTTYAGGGGGGAGGGGGDGQSNSCPGAGGGAGSAATLNLPGRARDPVAEAWTDPLLIALGIYGNGGAGAGSTSYANSSGASAPNGGGGGGAVPPGFNSNLGYGRGGHGGAGGGGGCGCSSSTSGTGQGGNGGFGGGGGGCFDYTGSGSTTRGGNGGYGGGGAGASGAGQIPGTGGAAIVLIYA